LALLVTPIIAVTVVGTIGNAIHPTLVKDHPLWLVAMEPRNRFLILVAGKVDYIPFVVVATIRRLISDPLFYLLGYLYGDAGVRWIENKMGEGGGLVRAIERGFAKAAPVMVFFLPGAIVCVLAGATGMNPILFIALNIAGTVTVVSLVYRFAESVEGPVNAINGFYGNNSKWLTALSVGFTILWLLDQRRRGKSEVQSVSSIEKELDEAARREPEQ
jgi:membrane protein DedA with SNARE-associated domain